MRRAWNLNFGLQRPTEAERVLDEAEAELSASPLRHDIQAMRLHLRTLRGEIAGSLRTADLLLAQPRLRPESMALAMAIKVFGLPFVGRHRDAVEAYRHARATEASWLASSWSTSTRMAPPPRGSPPPKGRSPGRSGWRRSGWPNPTGSACPPWR
jgi:hypothetical protein